MNPNLFQFISSDLAVRAALGEDPIRVYPFGAAPDKVRLPYAVWQTIAGAPENYIGDAPDIDSFLVQMDVYANNASQARNTAETLRDAIQSHAHIVSWRGESKDSETNHFRYSFDINFLTQRT